jgi:hypothetical protein
MFFYMRLEKHLCNAMSRVLLIHEDSEFVFGDGGGRGKWEGGGRALDVWNLDNFEVSSRIYFFGLHVRSTSHSV